MKRIWLIAIAVVLLLQCLPAFAQSSGNFAVVGGAKPGQVVTILGSNPAGDWYQIGEGEWIAAFLVSPLGQTGGTTVPAQQPNAQSSDATRAIQGYTDELSSIMTSYSNALAVLGKQISKAQHDIRVLQEEDWQATTAAALAYLQRLGQRVRSVAPPPLLLSAHNDTELAAIYYDAAAAIISKGVEQRDGRLFAAALDQIALGTNAMRSAQAKLEALAQKGSMPVPAPTPTPDP